MDKKSRQNIRKQVLLVNSKEQRDPQNPFLHSTVVPTLRLRSGQALSGAGPPFVPLLNRGCPTLRGLRRVGITLLSQEQVPPLRRTIRFANHPASVAMTNIGIA